MLGACLRHVLLAQKAVKLCVWTKIGAHLEVAGGRGLGGIKRVGCAAGGGSVLFAVSSKRTIRMPVLIPRANNNVPVGLILSTVWCVYCTIMCK